jgi:hypothetical protein
LESVLKGREGREDGWKDRWEKKKLAGGLRNDQVSSCCCMRPQATAV